MADDAAGAVRRTPRPARDELIKRAAGVIHAGRYAKAEEPTAVDEFIAAGLFEAGLLADPERFVSWEQWHEDMGHRNREYAQLTAERDAILPRLAELTEAAGKQRSTEWLRTCATLPMAEWPPAPAYKGPMVPAADLEQKQRESRMWHDQVRHWRDAWYVMLTRLSRVEALCAEWESNPAADWTAGDAAEHLRAALQGDQPAEPDESWESGAYVEPDIGGVANVSTSSWPGGVPHVWLRVSDYARSNHGADIVLKPDEADEIAAVLSGAAQSVRRDQPAGEADRG